jgi:hypothetical protein
MRTKHGASERGLRYGLVLAGKLFHLCFALSDIAMLWLLKPLPKLQLGVKMLNAKAAAETATRKMSNVETLRELTADELDIVAGGFSVTSAGNNGSENLNTLTGPNHILEVAGSRGPGITVLGRVFLPRQHALLRALCLVGHVP